MTGQNGAGPHVDEFLQAIFRLDEIIVPVHEMRANNPRLDVAAAAADLSDDVDGDLRLMLAVAVDRIVCLELGELPLLGHEEREGDVAVTTRTVAGVELTKVGDGVWAAPNPQFCFVHQTDPDDAVGWDIWAPEYGGRLLEENEYAGVFPTLEYAVERAKENVPFLLGDPDEASV